VQQLLAQDFIHQQLQQLRLNVNRLLGWCCSSGTLLWCGLWQRLHVSVTSSSSGRRRGWLLLLLWLLGRRRKRLRDVAHSCKLPARPLRASSSCPAAQGSCLWHSASMLLLLLPLPLLVLQQQTQVICVAHTWRWLKDLPRLLLLLCCIVRLLCIQDGINQSIQHFSRTRASLLQLLQHRRLCCTALAPTSGRRRCRARRQPPCLQALQCAAAAGAPRSTWKAQRQRCASSWCLGTGCFDGRPLRACWPGVNEARQLLVLPLLLWLRRRRQPRACRCC
jgi:hypothetical protein